MSALRGKMAHGCAHLKCSLDGVILVNFLSLLILKELGAIFIIMKTFFSESKYILVFL